MLARDIVERQIQELKIELNSDFARQLKRHATIILFWGEKKSDLETGHIALIIPYEESYVYISFWPKSEAEQSKLKNTITLITSPVNGVFHSYEDDYKNENKTHFTKAYVLFGLNVDSMCKYLVNLCEISSCEETNVKKNHESILKYKYIVKTSKHLISWFLWSAFTKQETYSNCVQFTRKLLLVGGMVGYIDNYSSLLVYDRLATQIGGLYRNCLPTILLNSAHFKCAGQVYNNKLINILSKIYFIFFNYDNQITNKEWLYAAIVVYIFLISDFLRATLFSKSENLSLMHTLLKFFFPRADAGLVFLCGYFFPTILCGLAGWAIGYSIKEDSYFRDNLKYINLGIQMLNACNLIQVINDIFQFVNQIKENPRPNFILKNDTWFSTLISYNNFISNYLKFSSPRIGLIWHILINSTIVFFTTIVLFSYKTAGLKNDDKFLYAQRTAALAEHLALKEKIECTLFGNKDRLNYKTNEASSKTIFEKLCEFSIFAPALAFYTYQFYRLMTPQKPTSLSKIFRI